MANRWMLRRWNWPWHVLLLYNLWSLGGLAACYSARQFHFEEATAGLSVPLCNVSGSVHGSEEEYCLWIEHLSGYAATCLLSNPIWDVLSCETATSSSCCTANYTTEVLVAYIGMSAVVSLASHPFYTPSCRNHVGLFMWSLKEFLPCGWINARVHSLIINVYTINWLNHISDHMCLNEVLYATY